MLVFIDESGDTGMNSKGGESRFFVICLVVFENKEDALNCDKRIDLLKNELGWEENSEFHFMRNSHKVKKSFLKAVVPYNFFYYGVAINKDPKKLWGESFKSKESFYKYACGLIFQNAKEQLENSIVVIDESSSIEFRNRLSKYLRNKVNSNNKRVIKKVKMQKSSGNNLLQLADYIAGVINRSIQKKKFSKEYRKLIAHREIYIQIWPK